MADVTISQLTPGTPAGNNIVPYSTGSVTLGAPVSDLFRNSLLTVGVNNGNYVSSFTQLGQNGVFVWHDNATKSLTATGLSVAINRSVNPAAYLTNASGNALIVDAGNVGIGTTTPSTKLEVNGTIKATALQVPGTVISVYQAVLTSGQEITSADWIDCPGLSLTVTPKTTTSRFMVEACLHACTTNVGYARFYRNNGAIGVGDQVGSRVSCSFGNFNNFRDGNTYALFSMKYLDSPNQGNVDAITYKLQVKKESAGTANLMINRTVSDSDNSSNGSRTISTFTVMEIAG
jgi:hypothetical protein